MSPYASFLPRSPFRSLSRITRDSSISSPFEELMRIIHWIGQRDEQMDPIVAFLDHLELADPPKFNATPTMWMKYSGETKLPSFLNIQSVTLPLTFRSNAQPSHRAPP